MIAKITEESSLFYDFTFSPFVRDKCKEFAEKLVNTTESFHRLRGQSNKEARIVQATEGKIAEFGAYDMFANFFKLECTKPDMQIYSNNTSIRKSFDPDIRVQGHKCHVKSQTAESAYRFGTSWMFQYADENGNTNGHRDKEIFDTYGPRDFCCFMIMEEQKAKILACPLVSTLHERNLFSLPVKSTLQKSKRVVYFDHLKTIGEELMWSGIPYAKMEN